MPDKRALRFLEPLESHRRGAAVAEALAVMIEKAGLVVGDKLPPEVAMADHLGIGRSTIREALTRWEGLGLIRRRRGDGTYIMAPIRPGNGPWPTTVLLEGEALLRVLDVRRTLETAVARQAAERASPAQKAAIAGLCDELMTVIAAGQPFAAADRAFHAAIYDASGNPVFGQMLRYLNGMLARADGSPFVRGKFGAASFPLHRELSQAVTAGNADAAARAIAGIIDMIEAEISALAGLNQPAGS